MLCSCIQIISRSVLSVNSSCILMLYTGPPPPPSAVEFTITSNSVENFTVCLTWEMGKSDLYYLINTSNSDKGYNEPSNMLCLMTEYNTHLEVSVVAVNCAGKSEPTTTNISMAMINLVLHIIHLSLSWLWSSQSTSQWQCW